MVGVDRSAFPDSVQVGAAELQRVVSAAAAELLRRLADLTGARQHGTSDSPDASYGGGVTSGLAVTVGTTTTAVSLAAGNGYVPNGAYVELATASSNMALADPTNGNANYVGLMYREVADQAGAHETQGTAPTRRVLRSCEAKVLSAAQYAALPLSNADLTQDARDRFLICREVTAAGSGVALGVAGAAPPGPAPAAYERLLTSTQPSTITGVEVTAVDPATSTGTAVLRFNVAARTLGWAAPGASQGAAQAVGSTDGATLTLVTGGGSGRTLTVRVYPSLMPLSGADPTDENLTIGTLYEPRARRLTTVDEQHRHTLGSLAPSTTNVHGQSVANLIAAILQVPQTIWAGAGLTGTVAGTLTPRYQRVGTTVGDRVFEFAFPLRGSSRVVRVYTGVPGSLTEAFVVTVNARWLSTALWQKDVDGDTAFKWAIDVNGLSAVWRAAGAGTWADSAWSNTLFSMLGTPQAVNVPRTLVHGSELLADATGAATARRQLSYQVTGAASARVLVDVALGNTGYIVRTFYVAATNAYERVWNANWNQSLNAGSGGWARDVAGDSVRLVESPTELVQHYYLAAGADGWLDSAWTQNFRVQTSGAITGSGIITIPSAANYAFASARTFHHALSVYKTGLAVNVVSSALGCANKAVAANTAALPWALEFPNETVLTASSVTIHGTFTDSGANTNRLAVYRQPRANPSVAESLRAAGAIVIAPSVTAVDRSASLDQNLTINNALYNYYAVLTSDANADFLVDGLYLTATHTRLQN